VTITREPEFGNSVLYVQVEKPQQREIPIEVTFTVTRQEYVRRAAERRAQQTLTAAERARFLSPDRLVPIDGRIRSSPWM
jgi:predicted house-cleaning NTP pyrophosphatase (Maf/HAM1 superfamily)